MRALLVLILALPAYVAVAQQRPARDAADAPVRIIRGQVRSGDDSAAFLRKARVTVAGSAVPAVFTDQEGRFEVAVPESTTSVLRVTKPGFAPAQIPLGAASGADLVQIRLARGAVIVGRVFDELGTPVVDVDVRVRRVADVAERGGVPVNIAIQTDDLGEFRVGSLPAGAYELFVEGSQVRVTGSGPGGNEIGGSSVVIFTPNPSNASSGPPPDSPAPSSQKTSVRLRTGEEVEAALFHEDRAAEARSAAAYVSEFDAEQRAVMNATARSQVSGTAVLLGRPRVVVTSRGTAVITGRVTAPNGRGVAGAIVRLNPVTAGIPRIAATGVQGQFQFTGVTAGAYRVAATKTGFLAGEYGQDRVAQPGRIVTLRDRQRVDRVDIGLPRGAVVTGTVTDLDGEPLEGLAMRAWPLRYRNGRPVTDAVGMMRRTDDRGRYRLHGLQPGTHYVVATDDTNTAATTPGIRGGRSFYPGTGTLAEATPVRVDPGVDALSIDMAFAPVSTVSVTGDAQDSAGRLINRPMVLTGMTRPDGPAVAALTTEVEGIKFRFDHVAPGEYVLQTMRYVPEAPGSEPSEFDARMITVSDGDFGPIVVRTHPGSTVTGRIVVEGGATTAYAAGPWFTVVGADPDYSPTPMLPRPWTVRMNPDRTFQITGLTGPVRFTSTPAAPPGLFLKSVEIAGVNVAEQPMTFGSRDEWRSQVEIVFSSAGAEISGRVVDGRNEPVGTYVAVAFAVDRGRWYSGSQSIKIAQPDEEARFTLGTLPPGDYWVTAVDALPDGSMEDPELLQRLAPVSRRVALSAGQRMITDLPLARLPR